MSSLPLSEVNVPGDTRIRANKKTRDRTRIFTAVENRKGTGEEMSDRTRPLLWWSDPTERRQGFHGDVCVNVNEENCRDTPSVLVAVGTKQSLSADEHSSRPKSYQVSLHRRNGAYFGTESPSNDCSLNCNPRST